MTWITRPRSEFGELAAVVAGAGAPVVLLHGVGLRAEAWNAQIAALAPRHTVIAPDLPGHGESRFFDYQPKFADYVQRFAVAIASARLDEPVFMVGHSLGAAIALEVATQHPALIRGVVALSAIYRRTSDAAAKVRARAANLAETRAQDPSETLQRWFGDARNAEYHACRNWLKTVNPASYKASYTFFAHQNGPSDDALRELSTPALFITGSEDPNSTPEMARRMAALAPAGRAVAIGGAAHMAPMTHVAVVNALLMSFFNEFSE